MKNTNQSMWSKITNSATFKACTIGILVLLMLIPVGMTWELIRDREMTGKSVTEEISSKWGNRQTLMGPVITVPYQYNTVQDDKVIKMYGYARFLPEELNIDAPMNPEIRYRSIYKVIVYQTDLKVTGKFNFPEFEKLGIKNADIEWENAFITIGISDLRGIRSDIVFRCNGEPKEVMPGVEGSDIVSSGVTVKLPLSPDNPKDFDFDFALTLNGSHGLFFLPTGKTTHVTMASDWGTPSFDGAFLPAERDITPDRFSAHWDVFSYNRNFPQMWTGKINGMDNFEFGVQLLLPVDQYRETTRSVKYAIVFIALTFLAFFLTELISRRRIHPMQYLLVSLGLVLFYTLLLAISEQIGFGWAYLISASAIILLITAYSYSIFKQAKPTAIMGGLLVVLYVFLYTLLQLEDLALLIGSVGLFVALAVIMYVSRKVNWYHTQDDAPTDDPADSAYIPEDVK